MEFEIRKGLPKPRAEQETILSYEKDTDTWHIYTDNPVHARRWEKHIIPSELYSSFKVYHVETGVIIELEGDVKGNVSIRGEQNLTEEQRRQRSERMKKARAGRKG